MVLRLGSRGDSRSGKRDSITLLRRTGKLVNFFGTHCAGWQDVV